ncbi:MAG: hypothetical protein JRJ85_09615, partial [Deltaproteobacteria bacterium]|nr:hypothetical protein [Deltaproteobacteria bacterium]
MPKYGEMYLFSKSMALIWTFAELLILVMVRWVFFILQDRRKHFRDVVLFSALLFCILGVLLIAGEDIFERFLDLHPRRNLMLYRRLLWNFFCSVWVMLEGVIMIYVFRIYRTLSAVSGRNAAPLTVRSLPKKRGGPWPLLFLIAGFLFLFILYQYGLVSVAYRYDIPLRGIYRMSIFYVRICGIFWIIFEWVVALFGIRTYHIMRSWSE